MTDRSDLPHRYKEELEALLRKPVPDVEVWVYGGRVNSGSHDGSEVDLPELRAADQGVAVALESVLSDNTRRVYATQWRIFQGWCDDVSLRTRPAEPLTVARYLAARAGSGASIATLRLATSAISKAHEWAKLESPCRDPGVRASLKGWGRRLAKPQRQSGALTADVLAVIRLTAVQPRERGRGMERPSRLPNGGRSTWPWRPCSPMTG